MTINYSLFQLWRTAQNHHTAFPDSAVGSGVEVEQHKTKAEQTNKLAPYSND